MREWTGTGTCRGMKRPSATHIDLRRELDPRDYCVNPHQYGRDPTAQFRVPTGGDQLSATIARLQHDLVIAFRATGPTGDGSQDARTLGVSSSTWRRSLSGQRWMGETVLAVVLRRLFPEGHGAAGAVARSGPAA